MLDALIELEAAYLVWTPGQHDQYYHPLSNVADRDAFNEVYDATDGGRNITPLSLTRVASKIIMPSATRSDKPIHIPGGMDSGRFAFTLSLLISSVGPHGTMMKEREIIRGFTNHAELSRSGHIPDDMEFYLNSRVLVKIGVSPGSTGANESRVVQFNHSVLGRNSRMRGAVAMRPEDAVGFAQASKMRNGSRQVTDNRVYLDGICKVADRKHSIPSKWLASTINGYSKGMNVNSDPEYYSDSGDYAQIFGKVATNSIVHSHFYNAMLQQRPIGGADDNMFTFGEIDRVFPIPADRWIKVIQDKNSSRLDFLNDTCDWEGAHLETIIAYNLTHIMPATMNQLSLTQLEVFVSNDNPGHELIIDILDYRKMFDDGDINAVQNMEYIIDQIELDVVHGLLDSHHVACFSIHMQVNLTWNSMYKIQLDGDRPFKYSAPMFCDGFYSPLIDLDETNLTSIAKTIDTLSVELVESTRDHRTPFSDFFDQANVRKPLPSPTRREVRNEGTSPRSTRRVVTTDTRRKI